MHRFLAVLCLLASAVRAADLAPEFEKLTNDHEQAAAAAAAPINRKYRATLEKLLQTAQHDGDIDTQARIRHELGKLDAPPASLASLGPKSLYVGTWVCVVVSDGSGYTMDLASDGICLHDGERFGTWEVTSEHLVVRYDGHEDWQSRYVLPIRNGALVCKDDTGAAMTMTRRGVPLPDAARTGRTAP